MRAARLNAPYLHDGSGETQLKEAAVCARVEAAKAQRRSQLSGRFSLSVCQNLAVYAIIDLEKKQWEMPGDHRPDTQRGGARQRQRSDERPAPG